MLDKTGHQRGISAERLINLRLQQKIAESLPIQTRKHTQKAAHKPGREKANRIWLLLAF